MSGFFQEVRRRKVYRVAAAYVVAAGFLIQIASAAFPAWELPTWSLRLVITLLLIGFPIALILAWAYDVTPQGVRATPAAATPGAHRRRNLFMLIATGVIVSAVAGFFLLPHASARKIDKSIAVLPFQNLSADPENAFFTDGVQDEILNDLAKIADLKVISRTSVTQYKAGAKRSLREIAKELGVAHVVEGSVQRAANRIRVSAQLIDAKTDTHLWAESYDRPLNDVFAIQTDIAKAIAVQLHAKLSPAEKVAIEQPPTTNLIAYDRYLRAEKLFLLTPDAVAFENVHQAIRLLDQAVAHDPTFLLAYCLLSRIHAYLYFVGFDHTAARVALAKEARDAALRLSPDRGEPHLAAAWVAYHCYLNYETALAEVDIARRRLPNDTAVYEITSLIVGGGGCLGPRSSNRTR